MNYSKRRKEKKNYVIVLIEAERYLSKPPHDYKLPGN